MIRMLLSILVTSVACGGSAPPSGAPDAEQSAEKNDVDSTGDQAASDSNGAGDSRTVEREAPKCDDGTCTPCGDALCPRGWYCDESAPGGAACGWLPECAQKASCSCVKKAFKGCACEEESGSAHLTCG